MTGPVKCPFCGEEYAPSCLLDDTPGPWPEGGQCDCGAWWYEGMEDAEDD